MKIHQELDFEGYTSLNINQKINVKLQKVTVTSTNFEKDYNHFPYRFIAQNGFSVWAKKGINEYIRIWFNEQSKTEKEKRIIIRENKQKTIKR